MHGVTLERILTELVAHYGFFAMSQRIDIRCFSSDPSIASSLKFLRRTPWARDKVEAMYRDLLRVKARQPATAPAPVSSTDTEPGQAASGLPTLPDETP